MPDRYPQSAAPPSGLVYCSGGTRSGKSGFALDMGAAGTGRKIFVATAEARDAEMAERIRRHRAERGEEWLTAELPPARALDLEGFLHGLPLGGSTLVLDCLGTWSSALLEACPEPERIEELALASLASALELLRRECSLAVLVSQECGLGLVPADRVSRLYRDILGRVNQAAAAAADRAFFLVSGMPLRLK